MRWELWETDDGTERYFFPITSWVAVAEGSRLTWAIEAESWNEAMTEFHRHMGFEPYEPERLPNGAIDPYYDAPYSG